MPAEAPDPSESLPPRSSSEVIAALAQALEVLGCPASKTTVMAEQLDKRARQLSERTGRSYEQALQHLLNLMKQGWAASNK